MGEDVTAATTWPAWALAHTEAARALLAVLRAEIESEDDDIEVIGHYEWLVNEIEETLRDA